MAIEAIEAMGIHLCLFTETKLDDDIYTRSCKGYRVVATRAVSSRQGGVALVYRENSFFQVEAIQCHGPNVMGWELVTGDRRYPMCGVYIPPADVTTLDQVRGYLNSLPARAEPLLLGDLNVDLSSPASV